jgi:CubicO group peptidase (beta-lactamase class C family)
MASPESVGMSSERLARIRPAIEQHVGADKLAGAVALLARRGQIVYLDSVGLMDREHNKSMQPDTIFRLYSMTKPITGVALMTLYERGLVRLADPVARFIPAFGGLKVYGGGEGSEVKLVDLQRPVTVHDLLTHTSGLTYHWLEYGPVEAMYREAGMSATAPLSELVAGLARLPLALQPGTAWRYSMAHDVVAHLIERIGGQPLDVYLREHLFEPLGMVDTGFYVPQDKLGRFAAMYGSCEVAEPDTTFTKWYGGAMAGMNRRLAGPTDCLESRPHTVFRGGSGLVSTASDYGRFCQMLLNQGELDGTRILGRKTVELMVANHLPARMLPCELGGVYQLGYGYGLGVGMVMDVGQSQILGSVGTYGWSGAASTNFWIDPVESLIGIQMAQFQPSSFHLIADDLRVTAYQAIVD